MGSGVYEASKALIIGAALLAVPLGFWAGQESSPIARGTEPETRVLFDRLMDRLTAFR